MEIYAVCSQYMAFSVSTKNLLNEDESEKFIRELLRKNMLSQWKNIHIDVFANEDTALYIAYPEPGIEIRLADYALPFIKEYFTE